MSAVLVFGSNVAGEVVMLRHHVEPVFKRLGRPLHDNGAILGEDLPKVIGELEALLEEVSDLEVEAQDTEDLEQEQERDKVDFISNKTRFYPLLDLMKKSEAKKEALHWRPL